MQSELNLAGAEGAFRGATPAFRDEMFMLPFPQERTSRTCQRIMHTARLAQAMLHATWTTGTPSLPVVSSQPQLPSPRCQVLHPREALPDFRDLCRKGGAPRGRGRLRVPALDAAAVRAEPAGPAEGLSGCPGRSWPGLALQVMLACAACPERAYEAFREVEPAAHCSVVRAWNGSSKKSQSSAHRLCMPVAPACRVSSDNVCWDQVGWMQAEDQADSHQYEGMDDDEYFPQVGLAPLLRCRPIYAASVSLWVTGSRLTWACLAVACGIQGSDHGGV